MYNSNDKWLVKVKTQVKLFVSIGTTLVGITMLICLALYCVDIIQWFYN